MQHLSDGNPGQRGASLLFPLNSQWDDEPPSLATFVKGVKRLLDEGGGNEEEALLMKGREGQNCRVVVMTWVAQTLVTLAQVKQ